jgi:hypothetical protein
VIGSSMAYCCLLTVTTGSLSAPTHAWPSAWVRVD